MLPSAIAKARAHWERARHHLAFIGPVYEGDITGMWANFLSAANAVHEALKKGKKGFPKSEAWFAQKRRERRVDPLLNYMHQARNASEHGLRPVLERGPDRRGRDVEQEAGGDFETEWTEEGIFAIFDGPDGIKRRVHFTPPDYRLIPVYDDRSDQWFDPPTQHLGKPLASITPLGVGGRWLEYLEAMIDEAEALTAAQSP